MPSLRPVSREYRMYLAIWRKAWLEPDNLIAFDAPNFNMAVAMRQGMYRAIRPFRQGLQIDEELRRAADKYVVYLLRPEDKNKNSPHRIELRERAALAELESLADILGIDEEDLLLGDERKTAAELKKIMSNVGKPLKTKNLPKSKTPFYNREQE